jgi:hypothetical protein
LLCVGAPMQGGIASAGSRCWGGEDPHGPAAGAADLARGRCDRFEPGIDPRPGRLRGTSPLRRRRCRKTQATIIAARGAAGRAELPPGQASPNSTLRSSVQQRQPCQLHDCSSSRQLVTVLPLSPPIHRRKEILVAPQDYLCARSRRFRPPRLASLLRHCRPSHSRCAVITRPAN